VGDGFTKLHEYGLNARLTRRQRWRVGEEGAWEAVTTWVGRQMIRPAYGWTNGIRWRMGTGENPYFQADLNRLDSVVVSRTSPQKGKHKSRFIDIFATSDEAMTKVLLFIDRMGDDLLDQIRYGSKLDYYIGQINCAREAITQERDSFSKWETSLSGEQRSDELMKLLLEKYRGEHNTKMQMLHDQVLESLCVIGRIHGVRYMSISSRDLVCLEDVRTSRLPFGAPMAWHIRDLLDLGGCGNGSQAQVNLGHALPKTMFGTYYLLTDKPSRVGPHIPLKDANEDHIATIYDGRQPQSNWLRQCGATGMSEW